MYAEELNSATSSIPTLGIARDSVGLASAAIPYGSHRWGDTRHRSHRRGEARGDRPSGGWP
jgi:hypothetical protein